MATRARIGIETDSGKILSSYHHWDGYPAGLGYTIVAHYLHNKEKLAEAIAFGDASHWGSKVYPETEEHSFNSPEEDVNVYYGRDRGEDNVSATTFRDFEHFADDYALAGEEYAYLVRNDGTLTVIVRYEGDKVIEDAEAYVLEERVKMLRHVKKMTA